MSDATSSEGLWLKINIADQSLSLLRGKKLLEVFDISTASNGPGELFGSECTPRGRHIIRAKIGEGCMLNTVFVARRPNGEIFTEALQQQHPERDWILTRILWLSGCEPGINRSGNVDTMRRYIYIHGCPDEIEMGVPASHGCIRMTNKEGVTFFELLPIGTDVLICE